MADVVSMLLQATQQLAAECTLLQQYPLALRDAHGRFVHDARGRVDLVLVHNGRMLGIEVHGSREHINNQLTRELDALKQESWHRKGKCAWGALRPIWGNGVGAPKRTLPEWYADAFADVQEVVQSFIASTSW